MYMQHHIVCSEPKSCRGRSPLLEIPEEGHSWVTTLQNSPGGGKLHLFCQNSILKAKEESDRGRRAYGKAGHSPQVRQVAENIASSGECLGLIKGQVNKSI